MKNIRTSLSENFHFFMVKLSVYLNRPVFVMTVSFSCFFFSVRWRIVVLLESVWHRYHLAGD